MKTFPLVDIDVIAIQEGRIVILTFTTGLVFEKRHLSVKIEDGSLIVEGKKNTVVKKTGEQKEYLYTYINSDCIFDPADVVALINDDGDLEVSFEEIENESAVIDILN